MHASMRSSVFLLLCVMVGVRAARLGAAGELEVPVAEVTGFPSAYTLLHQHVTPSVPLVIREGVKHWSAFSEWTPEYLTERAGSLMLDVEFASKHSADDGRYTLSKFLEMFTASDTNERYKRIHAITEVPKAILKDMHLPSEFKEVLSRAWTPTMWLSGSSQSILHAVGRENINCLVTGHSEFVLINRTLSEEVYAEQQGMDYARSPVDVDNVDLSQHPKMGQVPYMRVHMNPGDCIFVPSSWFHHVQTKVQNIVVNLWFVGPPEEQEPPHLTDAPFSSLGKEMSFDNSAFWRWLPMDADPASSDSEEPVEDEFDNDDRMRDEL